MKTEYRGYTIEVIAKQKDGLWAADIWLWTPEQTGSVLKNSWGDECYSSANDAVAAGMALAKAEVDMCLNR